MGKKKIKFRSQNGNKKANYKWITSITITTFLIATFLGYFCLLLEKVTLFSGILILLMIIFLGVVFDGLGIAVTAAEETPFHSMAASRVKGSKESILLIRNASVVANFCNDVIGDISGIISGSAAIAIVLQINDLFSLKGYWMNLIITALIAALTVGGKAISKEIAIKRANFIVYNMGLVLYFLKFESIFKKYKSNNNK